MKARMSADNLSMSLALLTCLGLVTWALVTHYRVPVGDYWAPDPKHWLTSSIPVWAALIVLGLQMLFLVTSAVNATTTQGMGMYDMIISITTMGVTVVISVLLLTGTLKFGSNLLNGMAAFMFANFIEMIATIGVWSVANRRPGGTVGSVVSQSN